MNKLVDRKRIEEIIEFLHSLNINSKRFTKFIAMKRFITFLTIWISQNLAIPFWIVGHIHLSTNVYEDIKEIGASLGMNIIVAIGFYLDYRNSIKNDRATNPIKKNKRTRGERVLRNKVNKNKQKRNT